MEGTLCKHEGVAAQVWRLPASSAWRGTQDLGLSPSSLIWSETESRQLSPSLRSLMQCDTVLAPRLLREQPEEAPCPQKGMNGEGCPGAGTLECGLSPQAWWWMARWELSDHGDPQLPAGADPPGTHRNPSHFMPHIILGNLPSPALEKKELGFKFWLCPWKQVWYDLHL